MATYSIFLRGKKVAWVRADFLPRVGEHIVFNNEKYKVTKVVHPIVKEDDPDYCTSHLQMHPNVCIESLDEME